jgi:hypothetical protein
MKLQFNLRTLLLTTTFAGIWVGATLGIFRIGDAFDYSWGLLELAETAIIFSPFFLPVAFVGYALGKGSLTTKTLLALGLTEALALCGTWLVFRYV